jgi:hypothetical protein
VSGLVGRLRPAGRSLHPRGEVVRATLQRYGLPPGWGVDWLETAGEDPVLVRRSRSAGLPQPWPDVLGLAVRVPLAAGRHGDLLMSSAGTGVVGRHLIRPTRRHARASTTLLPLRSPTGPVLLGAVPTAADGSRLDLVLCRPGGAWTVFGELRLEPPAADPPSQHLRFDAVLHPLPGLPVPGWAARLRAPAYAAARRAGAAPSCERVLTT